MLNAKELVMLASEIDEALALPQTTGDEREQRSKAITDLHARLRTAADAGQPAADLHPLVDKLLTGAFGPQGAARA